MTNEQIKNAVENLMKLYAEQQKVKITPKEKATNI